MTRWTFSLPLLVVLLICGCGRKTPQTQAAASPIPVPDVTFCDVVAKPMDFEGKTIRLHAVFHFGIHGPTVGDRRCGSVENITWANLSAEKWAELERSAPAGAYDLVAVGKFSRNAKSGETDLWKDRAQFQFEVLTVEKVTRRS
jgi:hypothetical protein